MKTATHYRDLLTRETAHLSASERVTLHRCKVEARRSAQSLRDPHAHPAKLLSDGLTVWLMTRVETAPYWLRLLVARAAIEEAQGERATVAA